MTEPTSSLPDAPITVLTTTWNAAPFLVEALDSIRSQTFEDWICLIVDDASDDETPAIVEMFKRRDPRFRLIRRTERGGPWAAANTGLAQIHTKYVARMDADDVSLPHRFERQMAFMAANPKLRACAGPVDILIGDILRPVGLQPMPLLPGSLNWAMCLRFLLPSTALFETDALREIGGYVELPASQDLRVWCEMTRRRWLGLIPEILVHWRQHEHQISSRLSGVQQRLGFEIAREHLLALTGEDWPVDDVSTLRTIGASYVPLRRGLEFLGRFDEAWRKDRSLDAAERQEVERFVGRVRRRHLKLVARRRLRSAVSGRTLLWMTRPLRRRLKAVTDRRMR